MKPTRGRDTDIRFMRMALALAENGVGTTRPNPPVGAVITKNERVIGRGAHLKAGRPHAEIAALREAGQQAKGATLYVTLEPCSTTGRTPPCTTALLDAGLQRVVIGTSDPNPIHAGRGQRLLKRGGLHVTTGCCREEAETLIEPFACWVTQGRPFVTLKLAQTLDGKIADRRGDSKWITGVDARNRVQEMRRKADGILVGAQTIIHDDPSLLPRPAHGRKPWRIILDSQGRLHTNKRIFSDGKTAQTLVVTTRACPKKIADKWRATGATVEVVASSRGRVSLKALMKRLAAMGLLHILCEGGGEVAGSLVKAQLVNRIYLFVAPTILGEKATTTFQGVYWLMQKKPTWQYKEVEEIGDDLLLTLNPY